MKMQKKIILKKAIKCLLILGLVLIETQAIASKEDYYAGIEVGSKGVKLCILNPSLPANELSKKVVYDTTINSDFIKFSPTTSDATVLAVLRLYIIANQTYSVNSKNIFLAISSGLNQTAHREKKLDEIDLLIASIKSVLKDPEREVEVVSVYEESIFTHKSIIPTSENMTTIIIDIGSGNTKGGYFISSNVFNVFNIPWGTKSTTNVVEKVCDSPCSIDDFSTLLAKKLNQISENDILMAVDKCGITNYDFKILFSGGIAWATATLAKPDLIKEEIIDLSFSETEKFHNQLVKNFDKLTGGEYSQLYIDQKYQVQKVFNQTSLIGGSGLLLRLMKKFERVNGTKKFGFIKNNKAGWLPGYIMNKIDTRTGKTSIVVPK
jgi:hypothetical protein